MPHTIVLPFPDPPREIPRAGLPYWRRMYRSLIQRHRIRPDSSYWETSFNWIDPREYFGPHPEYDEGETAEQIAANIWRMQQWRFLTIVDLARGVIERSVPGAPIPYGIGRGGTVSWLRRPPIGITAR